MLKIKCLSLDLKNNSELAIPYEYLLHRSKYLDFYIHAICIYGIKNGKKHTKMCYLGEKLLPT